jgi:hypothetical protein
VHNLRGVRGMHFRPGEAGDRLRSGEMSGRGLSDGILSIEPAPRVRSVPTCGVRKLGAGNETLAGTGGVFAPAFSSNPCDSFEYCPVSLRQ